MPVLEEDSREELSSSFMVVPGNSVDMSSSIKNSPCKVEGARGT